MKTSPAGIEFLERHEGVVLRAYRDPVGVWTIGAGLTAASGVVRLVAGMVVTPEEAARLLQTALGRSYEPDVGNAMTGAAQHEFDAGVSFHWNTGAIGRASWVRHWLARNWPAAQDALLAWNRGGGRVLPGLTRRRMEEFALLHKGAYEARETDAPDPGLARIVIPLDPGGLEAIRTSLGDLGYAPGADPRGIARRAVFAFQTDHALTQDGIIGRATLSTLERVLAARRKTVRAGAVAAAGGVEAGSGAAGQVFDGPDWLGEATAGAAALRLAWLAFAYRDALAAQLADKMPRVAAFLRSF
jgi:lysozyme